MAAAVILIGLRWISGFFSMHTPLLSHWSSHKSSAIFPAVYPVFCTYMWNRIFICVTMEECGRGVVLYGPDLQR